MKIFVNLKSIVLGVDSFDTIHSIKTKIQDRERIPCSSQHLVFNGRQLENEKTLVDYNIQDESIIFLVHRYGGTCSSCVEHREIGKKKSTQHLAEGNVVRKIKKSRKAVAQINDALTELRDDFSDDFDYSTLLGKVTFIKDHYNVQEQPVQVNSLSNDQLLSIPAALAIHPIDPEGSEALHDHRIATVYLKSTLMTYAEIVSLVYADATKAHKREIVYSRPDPKQLPSPLPWSHPEYYEREDGSVDDPERSSIVFGAFSSILRLNCDIRDVGVLVSGRTDIRLSDGAWAVDQNMVSDRLIPKVKPYTLDSIASLNFAACENWTLGAWARAFGVGCGILPTTDSKLTKEWKYVKGVAPEDHWLAIYAIRKTLGEKLLKLSMNMLAMFGLLHLNKNETYKTADPYMKVICTSYIETLNTLVERPVIDDFMVHMEVACRTAVHPFGLGQTYWVARSLHKMHALAAPLTKYIDVAPPLVQRLVLVDAAAREWQQFLVGKLLNKMYCLPLAVIRSEIASVRLDQPSYSELWEYYGCDHFKQVKQDAKDAADALMPLICGFVQAFHIDDESKKDGLALEMRFLDIEMDAMEATQKFTNMWNQYFKCIHSGGLENFVRCLMDVN